MQYKYQVEAKRFITERYNMLSDHVFMVHTGVVEGEIAEFGIHIGVSFDVLAKSIAAVSSYAIRTLRMQPKSLHGFDSFQGMPPASRPEDIDAPMVQLGVWGPGSCGSPGEAAIRDLANQHIPPECLHLYPGWFSETLPHVRPDLKFSLVHIDCDFYESSMQVLDFLFGSDRLSDGSILVFDDFLESRGSKKLGQRKAWLDCVQKYKPDFTDLGFYGRTCWHCIIHKN